MAYPARERMYPVDLVVATIVDVEHAAFHAVFGAPDRILSVKNDTFEFYELHHATGFCSLAHINVAEMGNVPVAATMARALAILRPRIAFLIGIAAGVKGKVKLKDVVVSEAVYYYELARREPSESRPRPKILEANAGLVKLADVTIRTQSLGRKSVVARTGASLGRLPVDPEILSKLRTSVARKAFVASGEKLLADGISLPELAASGHDKIRAGDMEAYGFAMACEGHGRVPWLIVRGISDAGGPAKKESDPQFESSVAACYVFSKMVEHALATTNSVLDAPHADDIVEVARDASLESPPFGLKPLISFFDPISYRRLAEMLTRDTWLLSFLSTSSDDAFQRYHIGHAHFLSLLAALVEQSDKVGVVLSDTPNAKREHTREWHVELAKLRHIWESLSPRLQVFKASHHIGAAPTRVAQLGEEKVRNWERSLAEASLNPAERNTLTSWRFSRLKDQEADLFATQLKRTVFMGEPPETTTEQVMAMAYLLARSDFKWYEIHWFINFAFALAQGRLPHDGKGVIILEARKNRYVWEAMSLLVENLGLTFPPRAYFLDIPNIAGTGPMMANAGDLTIPLSGRIPPMPHTSSYAIGAMLATESEGDGNQLQTIRAFQKWAAELLLQRPR